MLRPRLSEAFAELEAWLYERQGTTPSKQPLGQSMSLSSDGTAALPQNQERALVQFRGPARQYLVSVRGIIQAAAFVPAVGPLAAFRVNWGLDGTSFETRLDGNSDQFLTVFGNEVTVSGSWDDQNFALLATNFPGLVLFPDRMALSASVCPSNSPSTAFRSLALPGVAAAPHVVPIPYAAKSFILRSPVPADIAAITSVHQQLAGPGTVLDQYPGAAVAAAHDAGRYMAVMSLADELAVLKPGAFTAPMFVEFLLTP